MALHTASRLCAVLPEQCKCSTNSASVAIFWRRKTLVPLSSASRSCSMGPSCRSIVYVLTIRLYYANPKPPCNKTSRESTENKEKQEARYLLRRRLYCAMRQSVFRKCFSTDTVRAIHPDLAPIGKTFFRYMMEHFALDLLAEYGTAPLADTAKVVNPAWRRLSNQKQSVQAKLVCRHARFAELTLHEEACAI